MGRPTRGTATTGSVTKAGVLTHDQIHVQNSGSNRHLLVYAVCKGDSVGFNLAAKYNGVAMNPIVSRNTGAGNEVSIRLFELEDPAEGSNTLEFRWGGFSYTGDLDYYIVSYTDCLDVINAIDSVSTASPVTGSFGTNLTAESDLFIGAWGEAAFVSGQQIEAPQGTALTLDWGPVTAPSLDTGVVGLAIKENVSAGAMTIETNHTNTGGFNYGGIFAVEIQGVAAATTTTTTSSSTTTTTTTIKRRIVVVS